MREVLRLPVTVLKVEDAPTDQAHVVVLQSQVVWELLGIAVRQLNEGVVEIGCPIVVFGMWWP